MGRRLGRSTRLSLQVNPGMVLQNPEGRNNIEGLVLDIRAFADEQMTALWFEGMPNLRLLQIIGARDIKGNFKNLFPQLRCIRWHSCPWTHIPSTFHPHNLTSIDMPSSKFKIMWKGPVPIKQLNNLYSLCMRDCRELKRLPEQLGEMKGLKMIDVSGTAIEKLPDSVTQLKGLAELDLCFCKKLRKIPEQIGNMEGLRTFNASLTAIEQLPDSFGGLINLEKLNLGWCKNLRNLQLGGMQCLESLSASGTTIEEVPDSIGLLSRLRRLHLNGCKKLKYVPESIWNLTSIQYSNLNSGDIGIISLPDSVKKLNTLTTLHLSCNVRLCLPMILCVPSLIDLRLTDEGQSFSSAEPVSLSQLFNLQYLTLNKCTSLGSSLPELPSNLEHLHIYDHSSLEQLPDLSSLRKLTYLDIQRCISLHSISSLPSHLHSLLVKECTSLQDLPDLSMLKELAHLNVTQCNNLKSISLKPSSLQVPFTAHLPNREVAEWFNYKSSGSTVSFDIPPSIGSNFLGLALWVVYTCKPTDFPFNRIRAVITNNTEGITENYEISVHTVVCEAQSSVKCITGEEISMKSGDRINVSIGSSLYSDIESAVPVGKVKVMMCGVHVIQDRLSTSVY